MTTSFITTAIPFVNARPHLGFAYELVLADILARHRRRRGRDVRFSTGTDDNSLKNVRRRRARRRADPASSSIATPPRFARSHRCSHVAPDDFIATSRDPRHPTGGRAAVARVRAPISIARPGRVGTAPAAKRSSTTTSRCAKSTAPRRSRSARTTGSSGCRAIARPIRDAIDLGPRADRSRRGARRDARVPRRRRPRSQRVARSRQRSGGWGLPVPDDPSQVIYVWFDALANYVSQLGLDGDTALLERYWHAATSACT